MLAKLAEGIPVDGMEALLPVLRPDRAVAADRPPAADGTPVLVCDPEKVRTRAADLIKTGREFLEASWSVAAMGGDAPDRHRSARRFGVPRTRRRGPRPRAGASVVDAEPARATSRPIELDIRPAPSARGQQHGLDEIFAMLRAHVATGGFAVVVTPGTGTAHRVVEQLGESDTPAAASGARRAARAPGWSASSRARCTTVW